MQVIIFVLHVNTDEGNEYRISFSACDVNKEDKSQVGVTSIGIANEEIRREGDYEAEGLQYRIGKNKCLNCHMSISGIKGWRHNGLESELVTDNEDSFLQLFLIGDFLE